MPDISDRPSLIQLNGFTRSERLHATARIRDLIVDECGGWIEDFHQFSIISISIEFEIVAGRLSLLIRSLPSAGISLNGQSESLANSLASYAGSEPIHVSLQVTFVHNEPDLRRHIPAVPG